MRGSARSWLFAASLAVLASAPASAQPKGLRGPGAELGGFHLIGAPAVQHELSMTEEQKKKAGPYLAKMKDRFQADVGKLRGLTGDDLAKRVPSLAKSHYDEGMKGLASFLSPAQVDRFDQILLQERGPSAMLEPEIAKALQLTNAQAKEIAQVVADSKNRQMEAIKGKDGDIQKAGNDLASIAKDAVAKADGILKPEQQRTWKKIYGAPISDEAAAKAQAR